MNNRALKKLLKGEKSKMKMKGLDIIRLAKKLDGRYYPTEDVVVGDYVEACFMLPILLDTYVGKVVSISNHREGLKFIDVLIADRKLEPFDYCFCNENSYWRKIPKPKLGRKENRSLCVKI